MSKSEIRISFRAFLCPSDPWNQTPQFDRLFKCLWKNSELLAWIFFHPLLLCAENLHTHFLPSCCWKKNPIRNADAEVMFPVWQEWSPYVLPPQHRVFMLSLDLHSTFSHICVILRCTSLLLHYIYLITLLMFQQQWCLFISIYCYWQIKKMDAENEKNVLFQLFFLMLGWQMTPVCENRFKDFRAEFLF